MSFGQEEYRMSVRFRRPGGILPAYPDGTETWLADRIEVFERDGKPWARIHLPGNSVEIPGRDVLKVGWEDITNAAVTG